MDTIHNGSFIDALYRYSREAIWQMDVHIGRIAIKYRTQKPSADGGGFFICKLRVTVVNHAFLRAILNMNRASAMNIAKEAIWPEAPVNSNPIPFGFPRKNA